MRRYLTAHTRRGTLTDDLTDRLVTAPMELDTFERTAGQPTHAKRARFARTQPGGQHGRHDAVCVQLCTGMHWQFVALDRRREEILFWDPYGATPDDDHPFWRLSSPGWTLKVVPHELQTDAYQCGVWCHAALELYSNWCRDGCVGDYADQFVKHDRLRPLNLVGRQSAEEVAARAANASFSTELRAEMRTALREAYAKGDLKYLGKELCKHGLRPAECKNKKCGKRKDEP